MIEQQRPSEGVNESATEIHKQPLSYTILKPLKKEEREEIKVGDTGSPAVVTEYKTFLNMAPLYLWLACKQPHIIYYLVQSILEYFKFCELTGEIVDISLYFFLIVICIALEICALYTTYYNYTMGNKEEQSFKLYMTWNQEKSCWQMTQLGNLKEGQIILVKKYLQGNNLVNPTNLLPIAYAGHSRHMLIKTTRINKRQEYRKVSILPQFSELVSLDSSYQTVKFDPELFNVKIAYTFLSNLGETFEAEVIFPYAESNQPKYIINNQNIVPMGIGISTQDFIIGIILKQVSGSTLKNAEKILFKSNSISQTLSKYLSSSIWINLSLMLITYIINLIVTELSTFIGKDIGPYTYCYAINFAAVFMNSVYISLHILLYVHRFYDVIYNRRDLNINCLSRIRTIDQLAQADTLIMDDFFFLERPINTNDFKCELSEEAPLTQHFDILLRVMEQSLLLQEHMSGHIIPIIKYFRIYSNNIGDRQKKCKVKIDKQQAKSESLVQIKIKVSNKGIQNKFMLRFNDRPVKSSIKKLRDHDYKKRVEVIVQQHQQNISSLLLFIEIMKLDTDLTISNKYFVLYGVITFHQTFNKPTVEMLKEQPFLERFNTVIMTNKSRKYIEHFMCLSGMIRYSKDINKSQQGDDIIILDQMEESQINQTIRDYKKIFKDRRVISKKNNKEAILFLNSTMITYLSRKHIRDSFLKLTPYCKFITFYNCSQFEKQICAASLFKIYPRHIFLSNYICDYSIFQWTHLSIAEEGASSQMLVTFVVPKYQSLKRLVLQEAMKSVQIAQIIINSHIFKNQFFLGANLVVFYLVFQGSTTNLLMNYLGQAMFFYNFVFTLGPIFYLIFKRPQIFIEEDMQKCINVNRMLTYHIYSLVFGISTGFIAYSLVASQFVTNVFTSVLITSVVAGNFFVLYLDESKQKTGQLVSILIQLVLGIFMIIAIQLFQTKNFKFIQSGTNFDPSNVLFYVSTFVILPFLVIMTLTAFAIGKEIRLIQNQKQMGLRQYQLELGESQEGAESLSIQSVSQVVVKVERGVGKGLRMDQQINQLNE